MTKQVANKFTVRGVLLGDTRASDIVVADGKILAIKRTGSRQPDAGSEQAIIAPTLFDIQVNGYGGVDLQGNGVLPEDVAAVDAKLARIGVSHWIPTIITASFENIEHGCAAVAAALKDKSLSNRIPGVHLEGPYISPADGPRGAHDKRHVRKPDIREFDRWEQAADGRITYVTIAPEIDGAIAFIKEVVRRGVVVSLGHHNATPDDIARAVDAGARMCTHLGNGMAGQIPRHHNPLWPQIAEDRLHVSLIADLEHLPPPVLKVITRVKGPARTMLTSDAVHIAGLKPGRYDFAGIPVELLPSGRICLSGTELLAGSAITLLQGVFNAAHNTCLTLAEAFASASAIPAALFGMKHPGLPVVGKTANFLVVRETKKTGRIAPKLECAFVDGQKVV